MPVVQELLSRVSKSQKIDVVVNSQIKLPPSTQITIHKNCNYMADLMQHAGIAISAGGTTVGELAFMQVPTLLVIIADNQEKHALWAKEKKINIVIDARNIPKSEIAKMIVEQSLLMVGNLKLRKDLIMDNLPFFDGEGAKRIEKELSGS